MKGFKKFCRALLFPHMAILTVLLPTAAAFLIYSMVVLGTKTLPAYISYGLSAYTLTVWCVRVPQIIRLVSKFKHENKYALRLSEDVRLRINISLLGSCVWNIAYALFQLGLGVYHGSFWFVSMAGYYISLALMRYFMLEHTSRHLPGERMREELQKYRSCGEVLLVMNLAVALMTFFMVYWNRTFEHGQITTITMAAYTFTTLTLAIVNAVKYRKYNSPVYSAAKAINLAAACVSMLTLSSTMLTTFGEANQQHMRRALLGSIGGVVSVFIITMAIYMIVRGTKKLKAYKSEVQNEQ